ncbi:hypothetical protein [Neobacillus novalis]|uniref:hypothetical protein n=1 Tax=Neobacillus novalis TaxID=220687 RepID=UPI000A69967F|nr:hypothetical protein [Neobacillus novalis]
MEEAYKRINQQHQLLQQIMDGHEKMMKEMGFDELSGWMKEKYEEYQDRCTDE